MFYRLFFAHLFHDVWTVQTHLLRLVRINDLRCHCTAPRAALFFQVLTTARLAAAGPGRAQLPARAGQQDKSGRGTGQLAPLCQPSKTRPRVHRHVTCGPGPATRGPPRRAAVPLAVAASARAGASGGPSRTEALRCHVHTRPPPRQARVSSSTAAAAAVTVTESRLSSCQCTVCRSARGRRARPAGLRPESESGTRRRPTGSLARWRARARARWSVRPARSPPL